MKVNASIGTYAGNNYSVQHIADAAVTAEKHGYDMISSNETAHNPYLPLVIAAEHTSEISLQTSIALSFSRSPMDTAYLAWDLQNLSNGRFILGLGTQVRGHIVRRFSMPWSAPAPRTREYITSLKHIWDYWQNGGKLEFSGDSYSFNLMPPFFNPGPIEFPDIKVSIAAVNPNMLAVAGELCDGVILHSFNTMKYTEEVVIPSLKKGATRANRNIEDLSISGGGFIVAAKNQEDLEIKREKTKEQISFYASTRSYSDIMKVHGWQDTHEKLYRMSIDGEWSKMKYEISDDMLDKFAVMGTYDEIAKKILDSYGKFSDSVSFSMDIQSQKDEDILMQILQDLKSS